MRRLFLAAVVAAVLTACSSNMLPRDPSVAANIGSELSRAAQPAPRAAPATPPPAVTNSLLPPLRSAPPQPASRQLEQRFDLKVHDAPIGQVLLAIVQDTPYSVLLTPAGAPAAGAATPGGPAVPPPAPELLTVNLKNVTVFEALDAIREMHGYDYTVDGTRIYVQPPQMRTKLYQVNYINGQRRGVSDVQVIGGASTGTGSSGGAAGAAGGAGVVSAGSTGASYASTQASGLSSITKADVWGEMEDGLRTVLGCVVARSGPAARAGGAGGAPAGVSGGSSASAASGGSRADVSFRGETQTGERLHGAEGCAGGRAAIVSPTSGTVVVRGMPGELRQIESLLRALQLTIERQVIIEAKVIDVELNAGSQQGINWAALQHGIFRAGVGVNPQLVNATGGANRGTISPGSTLSDLLGPQLLGTSAANAFSAGLGVAIQATNFSALLNFLESQGNVHVLSSPRIATLNNQKAVLKVGAEESFVTNISGGSSVVTNGTAQTVPPTLTYQPFFSGISLDVTPQIDENDNITLHVRTMVNTISEREKLALPTPGSTFVPFAVNNISETDSVVKTRDSQVVVIGGLMTERTSDTRNRVPVAGDVPVVGAFFGRAERTTTKRELVILLKPTVVKGDDAWSGEIGAAQRRIEKIETTPVPGLLPVAQQ